MKTDPQVSFDGRASVHRRHEVEARGRTVEGEFTPFRQTAVTYARRIDTPFLVTNADGRWRGQPGDWLALSPLGELYVISAEEFEATYAPVGPFVQVEVTRLAECPVCGHHELPDGPIVPRSGPRPVGEVPA